MGVLLIVEGVACLDGGVSLGVSRRRKRRMRKGLRDGYHEANCFVCALRGFWDRWYRMQQQEAGGRRRRSRINVQTQRYERVQKMMLAMPKIEQKKLEKQPNVVGPPRA